MKWGYGAARSLSRGRPVRVPPAALPGRRRGRPRGALPRGRCRAPLGRPSDPEHPPELLRGVRVLQRHRDLRLGHRRAHRRLDRLPDRPADPEPEELPDPPVRGRRDRLPAPPRRVRGGRPRLRAEGGTVGRAGIDRGPEQHHRGRPDPASEPVGASGEPHGRLPHDPRVGRLPPRHRRHRRRRVPRRTRSPTPSRAGNRERPRPRRRTPPSSPGPRSRRRSRPSRPTRGPTRGPSSSPCTGGSSRRSTPGPAAPVRGRRGRSRRPPWPGGGSRPRRRTS